VAAGSADVFEGFFLVAVWEVEDGDASAFACEGDGGAEADAAGGAGD
jgi:hypothetical protein